MTLAALVVLAGGCKKGPNPSHGASDSAVVAHVGETEITVSEFRRELEQQPQLARANLSSLNARKELIENRIRFTLLVDEARREKLDQDPDVRSTLDRLMVQKLIQRNAEAAAKPTDEDLQAYYQAHLAQFSRPERLRISEVLFATQTGGAARGSVQHEADQRLAELKKLPPGKDAVEFASLAAKRSDDRATKGVGGDLGFLSHDELEKRLGPSVAHAAAEQLKNPGDLIEVSDSKGVYLLKLSGRQPGMNVSFEMAKPRLANMLEFERRSKATDELIKSLRSKAKVTIDDHVLESLELGGSKRAAALPQSAQHPSSPMH